MVNSTSTSDFPFAGDEPATRIKAVAVLFLILTWTSVALRCYVRIYITKLFRIDDWLSVGTLVCIILSPNFSRKSNLGCEETRKLICEKLDCLHLLLHLCLARGQFGHREAFL